MAAYLGEIRIFCGDFAPAGWAFCDGQLLDIQEHRALFALLGTTYGGDGKESFALPDLRGRVVLHEGTSESGNRYVLGAKGGVEEVALNDEQMPQHTHRVLARRGTGNTASPSGALHAARTRRSLPPTASIPPGGKTAELYSGAAPNGRLHPHAVRPSGGSQPHDNMMPFLTLGFILSLDGKDPSAD
ncbi:MAG TPA: tail fiber protein [Polyangiaceae bacterium]|nr:tail fiber protein [Polyangiaceae bacterium]